MMKRIMITTMAAVAAAILATSAQATTIPILWHRSDWNENAPYYREVTVPLDDFAGTPLNGQHLTLDLPFVHPLDLKLPLFEKRGISLTQVFVVLEFDTNGTDEVAWGQPGAGHLFGQDPQPTIFGSSSGELTLAAIFYPFLTDPAATPITGVHFDVTLPVVPGVQITGGTHSFFRVGGLVPDTGSTLALFAIGVGSTLLIGRRRCTGSRY